MSYCVNCGVELDATARACPLCHTPVQNPNRPVDAELPPPFPSRRKEVQPASKKELALLISAMFASVAVLCGVLNLFFLALRAALVPLRRWRGCDAVALAGAAAPSAGEPLWVRLLLDSCAVGVYVYLISIDLHGQRWFLGLALPIILTGGAIVTALGLILSRGRSILSSVTLIIGAVGLFVVGSNSLWTAGWAGAMNRAGPSWWQRSALP